jgi:hypothetical protein
LFTLGSFFKITKVAHSLRLPFPQLRLRTDFGKNGLGYVLGNIFQKLFWSPWILSTWSSSWSPQGLIYTGCQDGVIRAYVPGIAEPVQKLVGHSANVVSLFVSKNNTLLSASWDFTAKVNWDH